jgi:hypothetical protein
LTAMIAHKDILAQAFPVIKYWSYYSTIRTVPRVLSHAVP